MEGKREREPVYILKYLLFIILFIFAYLCTLLLGAGLFSSAFPAMSAYTPAVTPTQTERPIVVLDAGHGGIDSGCTSEGVEEKYLNLSLARYVAEYLILYDVDVIMTRTEDVSLHEAGASSRKRSDVQTRVKIAREAGNPLFVSIHMNSFPAEKFRGFQVFYSRNNPKSEALALQIENLVDTKLPEAKCRNSKSAGSNVFVLDRLECQAVLIECGFLSNDQDRKLLTNGAYQRKLAFVIARAIAIQAYS
ncbi:MAG TPA: N-acetylmuramoyl-L-alanine amidase [Clostridiales bacterium]|nr:N-acetylmuramoyl-L-alanine amidase [Clostridiales bacterium]